MTATTTAAGNGSTKAAPKRTTGIARIKEAQAYHLASLVHDAAFEGERLCNDIYRTASDAYLRDGNASSISQAAAALAEPAIRDTIDEAIECLNAAVSQLISLRNALTSEPLPF